MMLGIDGSIKSVKLYKNLEKLYNKKSNITPQILMMIQQNRNAIVSTLFLNKSPLSIWITRCQFFFTNCRITIHYFLPLYICLHLVGRVFANVPGDQSFNPRSSHAKNSKNGTWCRLLNLQP